MGSQPPEEQEYDLLIIGAGPSAAGLLYGILHRIISDRCGSNDDVTDSSASSSQHVRIAILERGDSVDISRYKNNACSGDGGADDDNNSDISSNASQLLFAQNHSSTHHLQNWFQTAHYSTTSHHPPTIVHTTTPQTHLSNRIIDVPTGSGWGGGTNINAGLIMQPDNLTCDFDNNRWPGRWKGDDLIHESMEEILTVMEEGGGLTASSVLYNDMFHSEEEDGGSGEYYCSKFQQPTLSSSNNSKRRVNYFTSLIAPLLQRHPELHSNITFLSGVQVERILIRYPCSTTAAGDEDTNVNTKQQSQCSKPQAWAVECDFGDHRGIIRSRRDIVLCSGAIATPSLLLASGIGAEDDLRMAGIAPWYEQTNCSIHDNEEEVEGHDNSAHMKNVHRNLPVGHNLRDHIVLPRVFLTLRPFNDGALSHNSILGWRMIHDHHPTSSKTDVWMQLQVADGIQMDYMIPHFAAGALRRRWVLPFGVHFPQAWIQSLFVGVRAVLRFVFCIPVLSKLAKLHLASLNLCLLNPKSVGRVTVRSSKGTQSSTRLSDCEVIIDPNYLSDSWDVESLWRGWTSSSRMKQRWFNKRCIEILPGFTFSIGSAAYSLLSSAFHWMKALLGGKLHDNYDELQIDGNVPLWFRRYAAEFSNPYYHWCGTCAIGEREADSASATTSVVDEQLCVHGLSNLRICDASVFPDSVSAPPALTCAALGLAASTFIIE